jgi:hypothetical protein
MHNPKPKGIQISLLAAGRLHESCAAFYVSANPLLERAGLNIRVCSILRAALVSHNAMRAHMRA